MTEDIIRIGTVKAFSNKGGAYVACPSNLIGQEVWIIPKDAFKDVQINISFATTEFLKATRGAKTDQKVTI